MWLRGCVVARGSESGFLATRCSRKFSWIALTDLTDEDDSLSAASSSPIWNNSPCAMSAAVRGDITSELSPRLARLGPLARLPRLPRALARAEVREDT